MEFSQRFFAGDRLNLFKQTHYLDAVDFTPQLYLHFANKEDSRRLKLLLLGK